MRTKRSGDLHLHIAGAGSPSDPFRLQAIVDGALLRPARSRTTADQLTGDLTKLYKSMLAAKHCSFTNVSWTENEVSQCRPLFSDIGHCLTTFLSSFTADSVW